MKRKLLIKFLSWYLKKYHAAVLPDEVVKEIVDNFITFDSYYNLNKN